ncbi:MAG: hypothetical protein E7115_08420 [Bacteroidales bacterium]|nr:hypothetical protein [Bacteroidales bacterium]
MTLCLWQFRTSQLLRSRHYKATVDASGYVYFPFIYCIHRTWVAYSYQRGLLRCSFCRDWAMRRP